MSFHSIIAEKIKPEKWAEKLGGRGGKWAAILNRVSRLSY
jgi:hypothetical protein